MKQTIVEVMEIFGGFFLLLITCIIFIIIFNEFAHRQMVLACKNTLQNKDEVTKIAVDSKTADYLRKNCQNELYRIDEFITRKDNIIRYKLCLKKRNFDFYLEKQRLLKYKVIAIKMY